MTSKINTGKFSYQYGYDLRNRLASANITRKEGLQDVTITSSYTYNTAGIRTRAEQTINGITQNRYFLLDSGHTGYAQVFEETSTLGGNLVRSYVLGDDVLSQNVGGVNSHLLYDGHGSTRQLAGDDGAVTANYAYDAYGKMLGGNPNVTDRQSATDLLYAGEQFDPGLQMEYLRARYYDQDNGRFNRLDPFDGNFEDPQSLHKYAYAHADPVNGIDPTGMFSIAGLLGAISDMHYMAGALMLTYAPAIATVALTTAKISAAVFIASTLLMAAVPSLRESSIMQNIQQASTVSLFVSLYAYAIFSAIAPSVPNDKTIRGAADWTTSRREYEIVIRNAEKAEQAKPPQSFRAAKYRLYTDMYKSESQHSTGSYSPYNMQRLASGKPPQMKVMVYVNKTGATEIRTVSMEVHHIKPQRVGGPDIHDTINLQMVSPWEHELVDQYRHTGYKLLEVIQGVDTFGL